MAKTEKTKAPPVVFDDADQFAPHSGGRGNDLLSHDGGFMTKVGKVKITQAKKSKNWMFELPLTVKDKDNAGRQLTYRLPYTGVEESGKNKGRKNIHKVYKALFAVGMSEAAIKALKAQKMDPSKLASKFEGKDLAIMAKVGKPYQGRYSSEVAWTITGKEYKDLVDSDTHRTPLLSVAQKQFSKNSGEPNGEVDEIEDETDELEDDGDDAEMEDSDDSGDDDDAPEVDDDEL